MVNLSTGAFFVALTITVVERAIARDARGRIEARLEPVLDWMNFWFMKFVEWVACDYATTHISNYKPLPNDALAILDLWLAEDRRCDMPHMDLGRPGETLCKLGARFVEEVAQFDASDRDILPPDFLAALRQFVDLASYSKVNLEKGETYPAFRGMVIAAREFGYVLTRASPSIEFRLLPPYVERAEELRDKRAASTNEQ